MFLLIRKTEENDQVFRARKFSTLQGVRTFLEGQPADQVEAEAVILEVSNIYDVTASTSLELVQR